MVRIGEVYSLASPSDLQITPDDRQTTLEIMNGIVVQDFGHVTDGDKMSFSIQVWRKDWDKLVQYWNDREFVEIELPSGDIFNARVVIKGYTYTYKFEDKAVDVKIELWRI